MEKNQGQVLKMIPSVFHPYSPPARFHIPLHPAYNAINHSEETLYRPVDQKVNFPKAEEEILEFWEKNGA
jgi:hypothetical protein